MGIFLAHIFLVFPMELLDVKWTVETKSESSNSPITVSAATLAPCSHVSLMHERNVKLTYLRVCCLGFLLGILPHLL